MSVVLVAGILVTPSATQSASAAPVTVEVRVASGPDDAEEKPSGSMRLASSDLELTTDGSNQQVVGLRFTGLAIPAGASITAAYVQFQADEADSGAVALTVRAEAVDDAAAFVDVRDDLSSRPTTVASVGWSPPAWVRGDAGPAQQTPDLATVVQEIVNRPGWASGNALAIIVEGTGTRTAESFDGLAAAAPLLHVVYETGNATPTTTGIADVGVNVDAPDTLINLFDAFDDVEDPDSALTYTIENNTNPSLFTATPIDGSGTLTLDYAPATTGSADITVRATDTGAPPESVETTFTVTVGVVNTPPTTTGIADVGVNVDAPDTLINLFDAFDDVEDPDSALTYTIENNTNPSLFTATPIDGSGTLTLDYAPATTGSADITVRATDTGAPPESVETTFTVTVTETGPTPTTLDIRVASGPDDAEEKPSGSMRLASSDLELTTDGSNQQVVGLRFTGLAIPAGASITAAYVQFQADEADSGAVALTVRAEAVDDAAAFVDVRDDLSSRPTTVASVGWSPPAWVRGDAGPAQQTPDLATVVQEIVNRPGWASGNALAIIVEGTGTRTAESFDGLAAAAPLLHVVYETGNATPTTTGIADVGVNVDAPDTLINLFDAFDDVEDPDSALTYTIENNTNPSLFTATPIDGSGTLTLDYAPATTGSADITVRATDTGAPPESVETTFTVTVAVVNTPPTTTGIGDVDAVEDDSDGMVDLFGAFDDVDEPDSALTYTIENNTNPSLFTATPIDGSGMLTLDYAPDGAGSAVITVRATDNGVPVGSIETSFTVTLTEVNDAPTLTAGSLTDLIVAQDSSATPLGLASLGYGPGGGSDEDTQTLTYAVTAVPAASLGDIVLADGVSVVTPNAYTLAQIQGMQFVPAPGVLGGPSPFEFTVTDNGTTDSAPDPITVTQTLQVTVTETGPTPTTLDIRVNARSDDAEERSDGVTKFTSKDLELVDDPTSSGDQQTVGMRFNGLTIPQGATITAAYVQFEVAEVEDEITTLHFHGQDSDNAATFTTADFDVTTRPTTTAVVTWAIVPFWPTVGEAGVLQQTPDLATVVQEIVDRPGWASGNSIAIVVSGDGERKVVSYDGDVVNGTNGAPVLHVEFTG